MRNFMKKSSLALLMTVLVLLTAVLVGSMVTASAEEVTYEAAVFDTDGVTPLQMTVGEEKVPAQGSFVDMVAFVNNGYKQGDMKVIKLYKDVELTSVITLGVGKIAKIDGQDHTIYIDESLNQSERGGGTNADYFITTTGAGYPIAFENLNLNGQDMDWDGTEAKASYFGTKNAAGGAIQVPATLHFEMINCTMKQFRTLSRSLCINVTGNCGTTYSADHGLFFTDTVITDNYHKWNYASINANAIAVPQSWVADNYGGKIHVSGNTVIAGNYDYTKVEEDEGSNTAYPSANLFITGVANSKTQGSVLVVEEDFTGRVDVILPGDISNSEVRRGAVFFCGESFNEDGDLDRNGAVYAWVRTNASKATFVQKYIEPENEEMSNFEGTGSPMGNWPVVLDSPSTTSNVAVFTVMDATGAKVLFTYKARLESGAALPTWATWSDGTNTVANHTLGTKAYTGKVASTTEALLSTDNGNTWTIGTVKQAWRARNAADTATQQFTNVEVCGDYVLTETINAAYNCAATFDFNGFTVTRSANTYYFHTQGTSSGAGMSWTIKNANFDGKIGGEITTNGMQMINVVYSNTKVTFDNCTFTDFVTTSGTASNGKSRAAAISVGYRSAVVLKDVVMTNCEGMEGAVHIYGASNDAADANINMGAVYVEGNTQIANTASTAKQRIGAYNCGAVVAVSGTFTGNVEVSTYGVANNQPTFGKASSTDWAGTDVVKKCAVPEGAKILGKIFVGNTFAYNNNGTLCWINPGVALDATNVTAVTYDADTNTLSGKVWHYNDGAKYVPTTTAVAGYYDYAIMDVEAEAVINASTLVYGDLATVIGKATAGQTVEVLKDVDGIRNIAISKAITLDGNGHTLTWYIAADPAAEADSTAYMFKAATGGIVYKDILFHGGAAEKGVWAGALAQNNATMLPHGAAVTFNNCTITGVRVEWNASSDTGYLFGAQSSKLTLVDVTITDNIVKIGTGGYNSAPHIFRQNVANALNLSGKMVIDENYRIAADGKAYQGNLQVNNVARVVVGQLTEGSEVHTFWAGSYTPELNAEGKPYNNSGYFYVDNGSSQAKMVTNDDGSIAISGGSNYQSNLVYTGTQINQAADSEVKFGAPVNTQGAITTDKFELYYMPVVTADYYNTDVVVKINGKEVARTNLSEYTVASSAITVEVAVGMAELTDAIEIELQNEEGEVLASYTQTAKAYLSAILAGDYANTMKATVASLLQYGAYVQTYFNHNTANLAMTDDERQAWVAAGILTDVTDANLSVESATVKASQTGSVTGIAPYGATLTMENQMSLRLYFTLAEGYSIEDYTFSHEPVAAGGNLYYMEAKNIGTASLATAVDFTITKDAETMVYSASPMSYVYTVQNSETTNVITDNLKNACEALYYYYQAAANHFGTFEDNTGFDGGLVESQDLANNDYGDLYGI